MMNSRIHIGYRIHNWRWQCFGKQELNLREIFAPCPMCFSCVLRLPSSSLVLNPDAVHIWNFLQSASCWAFWVNDLHSILHQCRLDNIILSLGMGRLRYDAPITLDKSHPQVKHAVEAVLNMNMNSQYALEAAEAWLLQPSHVVHSNFSFMIDLGNGMNNKMKWSIVCNHH